MELILGHGFKRRGLNEGWLHPPTLWNFIQLLEKFHEPARKTIAFIRSSSVRWAWELVALRSHPTLRRLSRAPGPGLPADLRHRLADTFPGCLDVPRHDRIPPLLRSDGYRWRDRCLRVAVHGVASQRRADAAPRGAPPRRPLRPAAGHHLGDRLVGAALRRDTGARIDVDATAASRQYFRFGSGHWAQSLYARTIRASTSDRVATVMPPC